MTDFGDIASIIDMDITHDLKAGTIRLSQEQYTK
jgi:hypothetical protein